LKRQILEKKSLRCGQCGSRLIFVGKTETRDTFSKIVVKTYKCSDGICQKNIDKRTKALKKLQKEKKRAIDDKKKAKMRLNKRKISR
jgi:DNA-directed RNA polymerase subunit RPC12/RpoP